MLGWLLAAISPANTPHGYNLTFAFPMLLFIVVAGALYLRFRSPHKVPGHASIAAVTAPGPPEQGGGASGAVSAQGHGESAADGTEAAHGTDEG